MITRRLTIVFAGIILDFVSIRWDFGQKLKKWMEACIFNSSMLVLANGNATKDFMLERGLRQWDPLSPFLFVMAVKRLTELMNRVVDIGEFTSFPINEEVQVDILQFAYDVVIIGVGYRKICGVWNNCERFEMVFKLKVNFYKSKIWD